MWKIIPGFTEYQASENGLIKNINTGKILNQRTFPDGNSAIGICKNGNVHTLRIHRLVAAAFIPNEQGYKYVVHKDGNNKNNSVGNLEWSNSNGKYRKPSPERKGRSVIQLDKNRNIIKKWESAAKVQKELGINRLVIGDVCRGRYGSKTAGGFIWEFDNDDIEGEEWKTFENVNVSNMGRIKLKKGSISEGSKENGYKRVKINDVAYFVHVLVATCFLQKRKKDIEVNHKDGNGFNNKVDNLEWCTTIENINHSYDSGLNKNVRPILVYKNGRFYKEFYSIAQCRRELGVSRNAIHCKCKGLIKNPKLDYVFKYK